MRRPALAVVLAATTACWELLPASRDPLRDAQHREPHVCPLGMPHYPAGLFEPSEVLSVAPLEYTRSQRGEQTQFLYGSILELRPFEGLTSEDLERMLNCHAVRSQLGRPGEPVAANDPFWAPGVVVHIHVEFDEGVTRAKVEARDFDGAQEILKRARAFVAEPPSAPHR